VCDVDSAHRLAQLLRPRSIAIVGASDRSAWSRRIHEALDAMGYQGEVYSVNPRGGTAHGRELHRRVADLPVVPDLAYVMVPADAVPTAMAEVAAAGVRAAVVLTSGVGRQLAPTEDMVVLGPNTLGFLNPARRIALLPFQPGPALRAGRIGVVSQSGNIAVALVNLARSFHIGLSEVVSTGNELDVRIAEVVDYLAEDPDIRVITVFAESIRRDFLTACRKAREAGKPVVVLKVGRSEAAARSAQAHTGALVGDDAVIDAFLRATGVIRVRSLEDLLATADTFVHTGPIHGGLAVLTMSGGTCDIAADLAEEHGIPLADFTRDTTDSLTKLLPDYATVHNPLDVTGAATADDTLFAEALSLVAADPNVGVTLAVQELDHHADSEWGRRSLANLVEAAETTSAALANTTVRHLADSTREIRTDLEVPTIFGGIDRILPAVARIIAWTTRPSDTAEAPPAVKLAAEPGGSWSEVDSRRLLGWYGIPVVPAHFVSSPKEAALAARELVEPVAVKVVSADLPHKSAAGGVALGVSPANAETAAADLLAAVRRHAPTARVDGLLVSPMRPDGLDLLVGVVRDPDWGCVLAAGLGGVWTEVLRDVCRVALPASPEAIRAALLRLRAAPLLVDLDTVVTVVARIGELALALGDKLATIEVNPLRVTGSTVEALDAAVEWKETP
jgi:acyl-CoA synthetase (NDP forming)